VIAVARLLRRLAALLVIGGLLAAGPAMAQKKPTPHELQLARRVVVESGLSRSFQGIIAQMEDEIRRSAATRPDLTKDLNTVLAELQPEFQRQVQDMVDRAAALYAARLSRRQLADCAIFFASPSGKAYVAAQPALVGELANALAEWRRQASIAMMTMVREKMRAKGHDF
jgi:hypothetical protein